MGHDLRVRSLSPSNLDASRSPPSRSAMLRRCALRGVSAGGAHGCARRLCATRAHAGIFVDAENLQGFLKRGGASRLVEDALPNPIATGLSLVPP